jgi:hypothetical protein
MQNWYGKNFKFNLDRKVLGLIMIFGGIICLDDFVVTTYLKKESQIG